MDINRCLSSGIVCIRGFYETNSTATCNSWNVALLNNNSCSCGGSGSGDSVCWIVVSRSDGDGSSGNYRKHNKLYLSISSISLNIINSSKGTSVCCVNIDCSA